VPALGLPPGARVLDAPCGRGLVAASLRDAGFAASGADIDSQASEALGDDFVRADLRTRLPWPDGAFDAAFTIEGIEHLEDRFAWLRELHRLLRDGGTLVLTTPNIVSLRSRVRFLLSGFYHHDPRPLREAAPTPLHHIGLSTYAEMRYALHTCGFELVATRATHVKPVSYLYAVLAPWTWIYTRIAFRKERDAAQRRINGAIRAALGSRAVLFGENLLLVARKARPPVRQGPAAA
jgi:SAM-dependent methyltransferase